MRTCVLKALKRRWSLTEEGELLVGLQGLLACVGEVEPARSRQVELHAAPEHLHVGWRSLDGLRAHLHPHAGHHHGAVVVHHLHHEAARLEWQQQKSTVKHLPKEHLLKTSFSYLHNFHNMYRYHTRCQQYTYYILAP